MGNWIKCKGCSRVLPAEEYDEGSDTCRTCVHKPARPRRERAGTSQAEAVKRWREKTGNAYGKAYSKARGAAVQRLIEKHPEDFAKLMDEARTEYGLGAAR